MSSDYTGNFIICFALSDKRPGPTDPKDVIIHGILSFVLHCYAGVDWHNNTAKRAIRCFILLQKAISRND